MTENCTLPTILGYGSPVVQKPFQPKNGIPYYLYTVAHGISDDFGLRKPRRSETISAKKRYTLLPLHRSTRHFRRFWVKEVPSFRNHFSQKTVYLYRSMRQLRISLKNFTSIVCFSTREQMEAWSGCANERPPSHVSDEILSSSLTLRAQKIL